MNAANKIAMVAALALLVVGPALAQSAGGIYDARISRDGRRAYVYNYQTGELTEFNLRLGGSIESYNYGALPPWRPDPPERDITVFEGSRYGQEWKTWGNIQDDD